jgi:hypothetical protein
MSNDFYGEHTKRVFQKWQDDKLAMTAVQMADNDPTLLPPPKYTKARAGVVYDEPFRCAMEFVTYQRIPGDVLEFGTLNGYTARKLAELMAELGHPGRLMLFDSFQGMPSVPEQGLDLNSYEIRAGAWQPGTPKSRIPGVEEAIHYHLDKVLPSRVVIVPGWYEDTVRFLPFQAPSIIHIDCDLYASTRTVLDALLDRNLVQDGMILLMDDWQSSRGNLNFGSRAALRDWGVDVELWRPYGWHGMSFIVHRF